MQQWDKTEWSQKAPDGRLVERHWCGPEGSPSPTEDGVQCQQGEVTGQSTTIREGRTGCQWQVGVAMHQQPLAMTGKTERAPTSGSIQGLGLCFALFCCWPGPVHGRERNVMGGRTGEGSVLEEEPGVWDWRCPAQEVSEQARRVCLPQGELTHCLLAQPGPSPSHQLPTVCLSAHGTLAECVLCARLCTRKHPQIQGVSEAGSRCHDLICPRQCLTEES